MSDATATDASERPEIPDVPSPFTLGNELREVRKSLGLSIRDVVKRSDRELSQGTVSRLERGRTTNLDLYATYGRLLDAIRGEVDDE